MATIDVAHLIWDDDRAKVKSGGCLRAVLGAAATVAASGVALNRLTRRNAR